MRTFFFLTAFVFGLGCSSSTTGTDSGTPQDGGSGADASGSDGGTPGDSGGAWCPTATLPTALPVTYSGDTTGKPNLVTSTRLEWGDAPDDALLFVAPSAGTYRIGLPTAPSTNGGCGASAHEFGTSGNGAPYTEQSCPAQNATKAIDGIFSALPPSNTEDLMLTQGQHVLIWVSCTTWSNAKAGPYTLTIQKL